MCQLFLENMSPELYVDESRLYYSMEASKNKPNVPLIKRIVSYISVVIPAWLKTQQAP